MSSIKRIPGICLREWSGWLAIPSLTGPCLIAVAVPWALGMSSTGLLKYLTELPTGLGVDWPWRLFLGVNAFVMGFGLLAIIPLASHSFACKQVQSTAEKRPVLSGDRRALLVGKLVALLAPAILLGLLAAVGFWLSLMHFGSGEGLTRVVSIVPHLWYLVILAFVAACLEILVISVLSDEDHSEKVVKTIAAVTVFPLLLWVLFHAGYMLFPMPLIGKFALMAGLTGLSALALWGTARSLRRPGMLCGPQSSPQNPTPCADD